MVYIHGIMAGYIKEILIMILETVMVNFMMEVKNYHIEDFGKMDNKLKNKCYFHIDSKKSILEVFSLQDSKLRNLLQEIMEIILKKEVKLVQEILNLDLIFLNILSKIMFMIFRSGNVLNRTIAPR